MTLHRVFGIITTSEHKVEELTNSFKLYGIGIVKLSPEYDYITYLKSSTNTFKVLGVLKEQTSLFTHNLKQEAEKRHLELVDHHSILTVYSWDTENKEVNKKVYQAGTEGYIDLKRRRNNAKKYDWDDIFIVNSCHLSYLELLDLNKKISSRDKNISQLIRDFVHYKQLRDLVYNPQHFDRPIDFRRNVEDYINGVDEFKSQYMNLFLLKNIIIQSINQGAFLKSCATRRQWLYWCPGLNAGIPLTPKPKDPRHELTYQFHDFSHFTIPDLVYDGSDTNLSKVVYITYRLISEAVTLVLADMIFVNSLVKGGFEYKTVNQRRIYPIFQEIEKKNPGFQSEGSLEPLLYRILEGSFHYCFYGDTSIWKSLMENDVTTQFSEKYDSYFMEDFRWTLHNYENMCKNRSSFTKWWEKIKSWRKFGYNMNLQSISEFIDENSLESYSDVSRRDELLKKIFNAVYAKYIKPLFRGEILPFYEKDKQLQNAFLRYIMGQSVIFFKHDFFPESQYYFLQLEQALSYCPLDTENIAIIRDFYNSYLEKLERTNLITPDDRTNYNELYPIFDPLIVDYDHLSKELPIKEYVENIFKN